MEISLIPLLAQMEMTGVLLDTGYLMNLSGDLDSQIQSLTIEIKEIVGYDFNLNSTQQLSSALFDHMDILPPRGTRRTKSGHYSTAAGVLLGLSEDYEVVRKILEYREIAKLKSTYVDALPMAVNEATGRVHTSFNQTGTVTGRLASSNPNLQNIPIRSDIGRQVRRAFVAPSGSKLVAMDYSQIELRIAAHLSGDDFLTNAFQNGVDIHASTAAAVFEVDLDEVTSDQRRQAKAVNFGLLYGMGPFRLAQSTGITLGEAEEFIETYFQRLPGVKKYLDDIPERVKQDGFVQTLMGRRRYFPLLKSEGVGDQAARARAEREAINAPIQGSAADIIKVAMIEVWQLLQDSMPNVRLLLQVHDELLFECIDGEVEELVHIVRPIMESAYNLSVPLKVDISIGQNWEQMKALSIT
jgi:DNA polymerase-1